MFLFTIDLLAEIAAILVVFLRFQKGGTVFLGIEIRIQADNRYDAIAVVLDVFI